MANSLGKKLAIPQVERVRMVNTHIADALQATVDYVNRNTTPAPGNAVTPTNTQAPGTKAKVTPLNVLR